MKAGRDRMFSVEATAEFGGGIVRHAGGGCVLDVPRPFGLVLFGASGDLSRRKILPAIYNLYKNKLVPEEFFVLGASRTRMDDASFRDLMLGAVKEAFGPGFSGDTWDGLSRKLYFSPIGYEDPSGYSTLKDRISALDALHGTCGNRIFYLAVPPEVFVPVIENLGAPGLSGENGGFRHVVVEKPIGRDLDSARRLNAVLGRSFGERQIYRMDHYLAKETVQNILMFRFANSIFEPLWNRRYIDHVQITVAETIGIGYRAGYYDRAGIIRDMFQNHMFQLLALTAMEPPSRFEADLVRDERIKLFRSIRPFNTSSIDKNLVIGQYSGGEGIASYRHEPGVSPDSSTPTYCAMRLDIDNWRWNGVPFYLRSGKRLASRKAEISIHFKAVPHLMFGGAINDIEPNTLVLRIQPNEGISLILQAKNPGSKLCLNTVHMDFSYNEPFMLSGYERVLLDCMQGDQMLFVRSDGVEKSWELLTPLIERIESGTPGVTLHEYSLGSEGPRAADDLIVADGRFWRPL